ncbi:MAG TPA: mucoidy inhibitor MuiA family protein [candidate division Zixibacteria bacterium]|nr:mucoidy inhibitor MuiA family protein [candidate division Zixibacteria bacterium]
MSTKNSIPLDAQIDKVVVYLDGARIFRSGKVELKKGFQHVRVKGLTKKLIKDSVRVSGKGKGSLGAIDVETIYHEQVVHEELNKLIAEEKKLQKELAVLQEKFNFTHHQNEQMKVLSQKFASEFPQWFAAGETTITTLSEFLDFESKSSDTNLKARKKLEDEIEQMTLKIQILQTKINEYRNNSRVEQTTDIVISVDAIQAGPFVFEFSYQATGVNWEPSYDVDLKADKAILKGMAQIINRTLEDWNDVGLTISTAVFKPIRVVEPNPFYIDVYHYQPARAKKRDAYGASMKMAKSAPPAPSLAMEEREEAVMDELYEPEAEISESPSGVQSYEIPGKWTIPSDGNNHPVTLTTHELTTTKEFYWSATDALGIVAQDKITNGEAIILAGNAKVYSEGEFIGETYIEHIAPREDFKVGAREELKMKAEKKLLKRIKEKAGVVKGKRSISYEYELILKNFRKENSSITVKDVIPYSRSEQIKVKGFASNIEHSKENLGVYTWEIKIKPDEERKITYSYEVEWEKDIQISPSLP